MELWDSAIGAQLGASVAAVHVIETLKKTKLFPWLTIDTATANRYVGMATAVATAVGIQFAMTGTLVEGASITIQIPPLSALGTAILRVALSYGAQQIYYKSAVDKTPDIVKIETIDRPRENYEGSHVILGETQPRSKR